MRWSRPNNPDAKDAPVCCGRRMILRFNRATGQGFYGCWNRDCRHTEPANVQEPKPDWYGRNKQQDKEPQ